MACCGSPGPGGEERGLSGCSEDLCFKVRSVNCGLLFQLSATFKKLYTVFSRTHELSKEGVVSISVPVIIVRVLWVVLGCCGG